MRTINEQFFFRKFMEISQELTYAEVRMLYLLITEPIIAESSQQEFADRIKSHRRTINIGLKKLRSLGYIKDSKSVDEEGLSSKKIRSDNDAILKHEKATAKKVIINSFIDYYKLNRKDLIVNEDFFSYMLGDLRLPIQHRHSKAFVKETIRERYPEIKFYTELKKNHYENDNHYHIVRLINSELIRAKKNRFYGIKTKELFEKISDNFSIEKEEALSIIKLYFPKIRLTEKYIRARKPYNPKN